MVLLYRYYRAWPDLRTVLCRRTSVHGQCSPERDESTGTGIAFLSGMGRRLPDRDVMERMADRLFPRRRQMRLAGIVPDLFGLHGGAAVPVRIPVQTGKP